MVTESAIMVIRVIQSNGGICRQKKINHRAIGPLGKSGGF